MGDGHAREGRVRRWGPVSVERHTALIRKGVFLHIWHDGVDVTRRCTFATDEGEGWAELLALDRHGKPYVDRDGQVARVMVLNIAIVPGVPLPIGVNDFRDRGPT